MGDFIKRLTISIKNPIIRNHVVYGESVLPGLSYVDLIYQAFKEQGYDYRQLTLQNLSMYHPLKVDKQTSVTLEIKNEQVEQDFWLIKIEEGQKLYLQAEMQCGIPTVFDEVIDINHVKQSAQRMTDISDAYAQCCRQDLVHSDLMKLQGEIYHSQKGILMHLLVDPSFLVSARQFLFHPALVDGSGVGANVMLYDILDGEKRLFVPLFYESFKACELLHESCWVRVQTDSLFYENELIRLTLEFFNDNGKKVAELKDFTSKMVREIDLINPKRQSNLKKQKPKKVIQSDQSADPYLVQLFSEYLNRPFDQIKVNVGYYEMGLDSPGLLKIVEAIGEKIGKKLSPTLLFEYTTIADLSAYLEKMKKSGEKSIKTYFPRSADRNYWDGGTLSKSRKSE